MHQNLLAQSRPCDTSQAEKQNRRIESSLAEAPGVTPIEPARPRFSPAMRNVLTNWAAFLVTSLVSFFLSPFVVHQLGDTSYGVWVLVGAMTGYLGLLDLGVRGAVTRYTANLATRQDHENASGIVSSGLGIFIVAGMAAMAFAAALAFFVLDKFQIAPADLPQARLVLILVGCNVAISLVSGVFGGVVTGLQRFDISNAIEITAALLRAAAVVAALWAGNGLVALALIHAGFALAVGMAYWMCSWRLYPQLRVAWSRGTREHLRQIFSFSVYSFLLHISAYLIYHTDSLVIGAFLPVSMVTFFAIATNLATYARAVVSGISTTMTPKFSAMQASQQVADMSHALLRAVRYSTLVILAIAITFLLRGASFIGLWMGPEYAQPSGAVLWILALALIPAAGSQVVASVMLGLNRHRPVVPIVIVEALANLGLSIWWVQSIGISGVAWATALPSLLTSLLWWPWYVNRTMGIAIARYISSSWLRPGCAFLPFAAATWAVERTWPAPTLWVFFVQVAGLLPVAALGAWLVALEREDRAQLRDRFVLPTLHMLRGR